MNYKWLGAVLILTGCGGTGFSLASAHRREIRMLQQLLRIMEYMECELQYRLTPLPELCRQAGQEVSGTLQAVFLNLSRELDWQTAPDVKGCMSAALKRSGDLPVRIRKYLQDLSCTLGRFDLPGQIQGLKNLYENCAAEMVALSKNKDMRQRSYQTLWLCAGAALAVLLC